MLEQQEKRVKQNIYFDPQTKNLAVKILERFPDRFQGRTNKAGWGHVVDRAVLELAKQWGIEL